MIEDIAGTRSAALLAASLSQYTERLIARRGIEQANVLFGGQIGPAAKALTSWCRRPGTVFFTANGRGRNVEPGRMS
jgi:hypothetical protein